MLDHLRWFILSQQVLYLLIQYPRKEKEEVENWRQRIRHPSVPVRLFIHLSSIIGTFVLLQ